MALKISGAKVKKWENCVRYIGDVYEKQYTIVLAMYKRSIQFFAEGH